jgi:hypothetical protein
VTAELIQSRNVLEQVRDNFIIPSMIFVTRNGKEEGPYSEEEVKRKLISNRFAINDLARFEGDSEWIPLSRLLNLRELLGSGMSAPTMRPTLVWLISAIIIAYFVSSITLLLWLRMRISPHEWANEQGKPMGEMLSTGNLVSVSIFAALPVLAAIALFRLRKSALYLFGATLVFDLGQVFYYGFKDGWPSAIGAEPVYVLIPWAIEIALIAYSLRLVRKGVLK